MQSTPKRCLVLPNVGLVLAVVLFAVGATKALMRATAAAMSMRAAAGAVVVVIRLLVQTKHHCSQAPIR